MTEEGQIIVKMIGNRLVTTRRMWAFDPEGRSRCLRDTRRRLRPLRGQLGWVGEDEHDCRAAR
jgi:hypothetical protein